MLNLLVSIIIPVYNGERYLAECVQSVLNQTWRNIEIIIVDDGSTDTSLSIASCFSGKNVRVLTQKNSGAATARNHGIAESKGDYIQFLDADDLLSPTKIESQIKLLQTSPNHLGLCATVYFYDGTDPYSIEVIHEWFSVGSNDPVDFLIKLYGGGLIGPGYGGMIQPNSWLTPRNIIDKAGLWNETHSPDDDGEFFCRVILASDGIKYSHEGLNYYRKFYTTHNLSSQKTFLASKNLLEGNILKSKHLLNKTEDPKAKLALSRLFWENAFNFYNIHPQLSKNAEKLARQMDPKYKPIFYSGWKRTFTQVFGWKALKTLTLYQSKFKT